MRLLFVLLIGLMPGNEPALNYKEALEDYIRKNPELTAKYSSIPEYPGRNVVSIRKERIKRLKNLRWQLRYLQAFFDVVNNEFPFLQEMGLSYRVRYYATAYNHSFHASRQEIEQWMDHKNYPYGTDMLGRQYAYSEVSLYFFRNHFNKIFKSKN